MKGYYRNLLQLQSHHVELIVEKNTVDPILRPVASEYCVPITSGRGYCSLPPRAAIANRYRKSGKDKLILILVSDLDADGEEIAHSFARSMRDDFCVEGVHPVKAALTIGQVDEHALPPSMEAKRSSANYRKFVERFGTDAFELEALEPADLQNIVRSTIDRVLDVDAFNREVDTEKQDAAFLDGVRKTLIDTISQMNVDGV